MSKKRAKPDSHKGTSIPFRVDDLRMVEVLDTLARRERRSRNSQILLMLETELRRLGLWPPATDAPPGESSQGDQGERGK